MAYEKQEWVDDDKTKGKVTAERMTHIEQGIYDNSLATDKINPSGIATITDEFTSGQIEDVIGFKSFKLKGQTSQGENPAPDSPKDVNNVSGYNVIRISNKNILKFETAKTNVVAGVTMTCDDNTTFTMNGTKTSGTQLVSAFNLQPTKLVGQYKFTGYTRQDTYVQLYWKDKNGTIKYSTLNSSPTINFSEGDYLYQ